MFFSWFTKNKNFNKNKGISGQIMPFLLVIIAIFLGATMAVVKLGREVINITCTENAMDDCSLDAASIWSQALNDLVGMNEEMKTGYDDFFAQEIKPILTTRGQHIKDAGENIRRTIESIHGADVPAVGEEPVCTIWGKANIASTRLRNAAKTAQAAADSFDEATKDAITVLNNAAVMAAVGRAQYYDIRQGMEEAYTAAKEAGATIAQLNIEECLIQYPDGSTETDGGIIGESYTTASVYVPNISSYQLQVTQMSKPCPFLHNSPGAAGLQEICGAPGSLDGPDRSIELPPETEGVPPPEPPLWEQLGVLPDYMGPYALGYTARQSEMMSATALTLECAANVMWFIYNTTKDLANSDCCKKFFPTQDPNIGDIVKSIEGLFLSTAYASSILISIDPLECVSGYAQLKQLSDSIYDILINNIGYLDIASDVVHYLKEHNQKIMDTFDPANKKIISSSNAGHVFENNPVYDPTGELGLGDMPFIVGNDAGSSIIIGIDSLTLEPGCISCEGGGQSSGAGYGGGSMADDGTGSYTPGLSEYCPSAEWGSGGTTGTAQDDLGACIGGGVSGGSH